MSVRVADRYKNTNGQGSNGGVFKVLLACEHLATYSINIMDNEKKFSRTHSRMIDKLSEEVTGIYHKARSANNIRVTNSDQFNARRSLQNEAIGDCEILLTDIQIAKGLFHLSTKRVETWGNKVLDAQSLLRSWRDSDRSRYSNVK